jgi:hypothetical protein
MILFIIKEDVIIVFFLYDVTVGSTLKNDKLEFGKIFI